MIKIQELQKARVDAGLTQAEAAALVYTTERTWRKWEMGAISGKSEKNNYRARSELFMYKIKGNEQ